jgi:predicted cupin superfamily sugar epimerase
MSETESSVTKDARYWIQNLGLAAHPEGGSYRQTYRSELVLPKEALPRAYTGARAVSTAIYFLLQSGNFSAFHRLRSDEMWHFYAGESLLVHVIELNGRYSKIKVGNDPQRGESLQALVKASCWFASEVASSKCISPDDRSFALVGCTVAPGFDFDDFELARRDELAQKYPQHREIIQRLTR